ncbi:TetR/AcrR family transcriptional regulator [Nonomuraea purpurea]|uniref:TetR/AcrR family transcriptional regulator n=1 Tax=Nonomuraea purpurea TaxID=1849276 RepID=A0ABV8GFH3_9ACTN
MPGCRSARNLPKTSARAKKSAVAARAGVSTGSVQHHFPTRRALMDEVLVLFYDTLLPDDSVHDSSIPARDRLVACLQRLLTPTEAGGHPRDAWVQIFDRYVRTVPADAAGDEYVAIAQALPAETSVLQTEIDLLRTSAEYVPPSR